MFLIQDVLVSKELLERKFVCNLKACQGACCWEGDWGAPLERDEIETLADSREVLRPYLTGEGNRVIDELGVSTFFKEPGKHGTPLLDNGTCAFLTFDEGGVGKCGIEKAYEDGATDFKKPISCHLYPIRHEVEEVLSFQALNYDEWEICKAACALGESLKVPVYQFLRDALVRKFGESFYQSLEEIAQDLDESAVSGG